MVKKKNKPRGDESECCTIALKSLGIYCVFP